LVEEFEVEAGDDEEDDAVGFADDVEFVIGESEAGEGGKDEEAEDFEAEGHGDGG
jgi:hypothetical protein